MFERMTEDLRRVIVAAQAEVAAMAHEAIGDDHLLLALAMGNDAAAELVARRVNVTALHDHISQAHPRVARGSGYIPFSDNGKAVLEHALRQALRHGAAEIGTVALLLAMFDVDGDAVRSLRALGVDLDDLAHEADRAGAAEQHGAEEEEAIDFSVSGHASVGAAPVEATARTVRPWPSPRCHGCRRLIRDHVQLRTLDVPDATTGETERFRFLYCGACGTAFAIERIDRET